jgi:predicted AlkP superfamily phosphohydrolase/phosphomutase/tetratricopeptide (TPR) repeat protein
MSRDRARRVLLVGWDAADWRVIHPLMDAGKMPVLERLVGEGTMANLATLHPVLSPMLWTSIATGKRPFKHGVLGFTEPTEDASGIRPVTSLSRKVKALWNILGQEGLRSNVVGWWPSHPAEPIRGAMVSNHYHRAVGPIAEPWPMAPGTVHPRRLAETLAELRFHPNELLEEDIRSFIPKVDEIDQEKDSRLASCLKILAECACVHSAATWLMEKEPWDFMAVYYDAIDHFSHGFMKYHPPRQAHVSERDFELYRGVVEAGYRFHDQMLGGLLSLAGEDTVVVLVSDHGFHPDHQRPTRIPDEPAGPAAEHRDFGVFAISGPGIKRDELIHGASLLDVAPTVLRLFDLPVGEDMDGRPLLECFEDPGEVGTIPSWEDAPGDAGQHPEAVQIDPVACQESVNQLIELGYIDKPDPDREKSVANTVNELRYNLARSYIDADRHGEALPILEDLVESSPGEYRFGIQLAMCYRALQRIEELRTLVEEMTARRQKDVEEARVALRELKEAIRGHAEATADQQKELRRLRSLVHFDTYALDYLLGFVTAAEGDHEKALLHLQRAERSQPDRPGLHIQIGEVYLTLKRWDAAERAFRRALEIDPVNPHAHLGISRSDLARRRNRRAADAALEAVALLYHFPMAHFCLGVALHRMSHVDRAVQALEVAVALNPNFREAHLRLARIYADRLGNPVKAEEHRMLAAEVEEASAQLDFRIPNEATASSLAVPEGPQRPASAAAGSGAECVTVVSGLPRSGTSMMMKLIEAGGRGILSDGVRAADDDNPEGYFELEAVKNSRNDASWIEEAGGRTVKVIHLLVPHLPLDRRYKVVMMHRDPDEVLASQRKMLERRDREGARLDEDALKCAFSKQLTRVRAYMSRRPCFEVIEMDYNALVSDPEPHVRRLVEFLDLPGDVADMLAVIDPSLYRNRTDPEKPPALDR